MASECDKYSQHSLFRKQNSNLVKIIETIYIDNIFLYTVALESEASRYYEIIASSNRL